MIQLLHPIGDDSSCILYRRWGRIGENGQILTKVSRVAVYMCTIVEIAARDHIQDPRPFTSSRSFSGARRVSTG